MVGKDDGQVAHGTFFKAASASVRVKRRTPRIVHADEMAGLVEKGVERRIGARVHRAVHQPRFRFAPVGAGDGSALRDRTQIQAEAGEKRAGGELVTAASRAQARHADSGGLSR